MEFLPASDRSLLVFEGVLFIVVALVVAGARAAAVAQGGRAARVTALAALGMALWMGIDALVVQSGVVAARPMPLLMIFFALNNLAALGVALSPVGGFLARGLPVTQLVAFLGFRLPLEVVLDDWARQGTIPASMTWNGANLDVVSGLLAVVCAPLSTRFRFAAWLCNGVGFVLLLNVMRVAILSSPLPFAWPVDPPLQLGFHLPYALIIVLVGCALAGHVVLTRALLLPVPAKKA